MKEDLGFHRNGNYIGFSPAQEAELKHRYASGETCKELARQFGISADTVRKRMKEFGVSLRQGKRRQMLTPNQLDKLVRMRNGGHMWKAIARHFNKSETFVTQWFKIRNEQLDKLKQDAELYKKAYPDIYPLTMVEATQRAEFHLGLVETPTAVYRLAQYLYELNDSEVGS